MKKIIILDSKSSHDGISQCDIYGYNDGKQQISKGFLTTETAVQFKLYDCPIKFWSQKLQNKIVCTFFWKSISSKV